MNYQNNMISGNTEGTLITQLRTDIGNQDMESNYSMDSMKTSTDIRQLVNEINNNLDENDKVSVEIKTKNNDTDTDTDTDKETKIKIKKKKKTKKNNDANILEDSLYDGILLFIIFILMSQTFVRNFIGNYVSWINVNDEGIVPFKGVAVYGVIFVLVFIVSRLLIHQIITII